MAFEFIMEDFKKDMDTVNEIHEDLNTIKELVHYIINHKEEYELLKGWQGTIDDWKKNHEGEYNALKGWQGIIDQWKTTHQQEYADLVASVGSAGTDLATIKAWMETHKTEFTSLKGWQGSIDSWIDAHKNEYNDLKNDVESLQSSSGGASSAITQLQQDLAALQTTVAGIKSCECDMGAINSKLVELETKLGSLESLTGGDIGNLQTRLTTLENTVKEIKSCTCDENLPGLLEQLQKDFNDFKKNVEDGTVGGTCDCAPKFAELEGKVNDLIANGCGCDMESLQNKITAIESSINTINTTLQSMQTDITNLKTDVSTLKTTVGNISTDVTNLQTSVTNLTNDTGELKGVQSRITALETKHNTDISTVTGRIQTLEDNAWIPVFSGPQGQQSLVFKPLK